MAKGESTGQSMTPLGVTRQSCSGSRLNERGGKQWIEPSNNGSTLFEARDNIQSAKRQENNDIDLDKRWEEEGGKKVGDLERSPVTSTTCFYFVVCERE